MIARLPNLGLCLVTALGLLSAAAWAASLPPSRPNVVVVIADQWRAQAFGYAGDPNVRTPNLDRFARESVNFTHAISTVPVCSPARASLLTGQRALTHGVFLNDAPLAQDADSIARVFARAGYDTGYIGKWHVDGDNRSAFIPRERRQGFDYWKVLECTHNYNHSAYYAGDDPTVRWWHGYDAVDQTRDAAEYVRAHARGARPFLLFLAWGPPHDPYAQAPRELQALYPPAALRLRPNVPADAAARTRSDLVGYYAHCTALDRCFGELREALRAAGIEDNTILLFTSDHGDLLGSHGQRFKQQPFDESIRVPFLLRWAAGLGTGGANLPAAICSEDVMPTLLGLAGVPVPASVEGIDYSAYIRGMARPALARLWLRLTAGQPNDPSGGEAMISCPHPFGPQWSPDKGGREYRGLRTYQYTYVRDRHGPWLLFNNERDPYQLQNLVGRPEIAAVQGELDARLQRRLKFDRDEFLPGPEYVRQWGYKVNATGMIPYVP